MMSTKPYSMYKGRFPTKPYSMYKGRFLVKPMRNVASDDYIIDSIGPYLADRRNNDAVISNKLYV